MCWTRTTSLKGSPASSTSSPSNFPAAAKTAASHPALSSGVDTGIMIRSVLHRRPLTVRERIVAAVIALAALALIAAGGTAWVLQRTVVDEVIDNSLHR